MAFSLVDHLARAAGDADLAAVFEDPVADPGRPVRLRVDMGDVRDVDRRLLLDDPAGIAELRPRVAARHVHVLHDQPVLGREHAQNLAALALVAPADHDDAVALLDLQLRHGSEHLRRQRHDLHEAARPQLAGDRAEDAGPDRLALAADQDRGVAVEADRAAVGAADLLRGAHDDGAVHVALLDAAARDRLLDRDDDDVPDRRGPALRAAQHLDALHPPRAGIVGDVEVGLHLDHAAPPAACSAATASAAVAGAAKRRPGPASGGPPITTQHLRLEIGRLSSIRTESPVR